MSLFPQIRNGHADDGTPIKSSATTCPNCKSDQYFQTISTEQCPSCGLFYNYWGDGPNDVYRKMMERTEQEEHLHSQEIDPDEY